MIRINSKQSGGIHVVKPEEREGKAAVGRIWRKRKILDILNFQAKVLTFPVLHTQCLPNSWSVRTDA